MQTTLPVIFGAAAIFLALFSQLAFSPKISRPLLAITAGTVAVAGLIFYGICYSTIYDHAMLSILHTCYTMLCLFLGGEAPEILNESVLMRNEIAQAFSTALGFLGVFSTTGAAACVIGAKLLRNAQLFLRRSKDLAVIYSLTPSTLNLAKELTEESDCMVVFVDENPDAGCAATVAELGCVIRSDAAAVNADPAFLRSVGIARGKRHVRLYALSQDRFANGSYAGNFMASAQLRGVRPKQLSLTIFTEEDTLETDFAHDGQGFGQVLCVNEEYIAARLLMKKAPPYETMSFGADCRATEDFSALVVGAGNVGQAVIKQLVMNGQFAGSQFHLDIFDPEFHAISGMLHHECGLLFDRYDIRVHSADARSDQMYAFLSENWKALNYIVICTGSDRLNQEIARQLSHFLDLHHSALPLYICSTRGLQKIVFNKSELWDIYTAQVLCTDALDRMAMLLNHHYCCNGKSVQENWADCDYFGRMSSRASADFALAFLKMAGVDDPAEGSWVSGERLENLAITEHARWCAFHYCMGFRPMTDEEFRSRGETFLREKDCNPGTRFRIGKDISRRVHCCLVPWEELDALSHREAGYTGKDPQYKALDRNNVLALPELLRAMKG